MENKKVCLPLGMFILICIGGWLTLNETVEGSCSYNTQDMRPLYFDCEAQRDWLSKIPEMPADFYDIRGLFLYNYIDFGAKVLNRSYWMQPEWFPNFEQNVEEVRSKLEYQRSTGRNFIMAWSTGVYPSKFYAGNFRPGDNFTVYAWVKNIASQWKYEGVGLDEYYADFVDMGDSRIVLGFENVTQNPAYVMDHIGISLSPDEFVLTPAYPNLTKGYVQMIRIDVSLSDDIEPGRYIAGFATGPVSEKFSKAMYEQMGFKYTDSRGPEFHANPRHYNLVIEVEK